jgi:hypothetical protein
MMCFGGGIAAGGLGGGIAARSLGGGEPLSGDSQHAVI